MNYKLIFEFNILNCEKDYSICENIIKKAEGSFAKAKSIEDISKVVYEIIKGSQPDDLEKVVEKIYYLPTDKHNFIQIICNKRTGKKTSKEPPIYQIYPQIAASDTIAFSINEQFLNLTCHYHFFINQKDNSKLDSEYPQMSLLNLQNYLLLKFKYPNCSIAVANKDDSHYYRLAHYFKLLCWRDIMLNWTDIVAQHKQLNFLDQLDNNPLTSKENKSANEKEDILFKLLNSSDFYNTTYAKNAKKSNDYSKLPSKSFKDSTEKVFPALIINKTIHMALDELIDKDFIELIQSFVEQEKSAGDYLLKLIKGKAGEQLGTTPEERERQCLRAFVANIIGNHLGGKIDLFMLETNKMTLSSALFLSMRYSKEKEIKDTAFAIEEATGYGAAIRQLTENIIYHSTYKTGILLIRHCDSAMHYVMDLQTRFMGFPGLNEKDKDYLEIRIADLSDKGILDTFKEDHKEDTDYNQLINRPELDVFFDRNGPIWKSFDSIVKDGKKSNRTKHRGLYDFYKIVNWNNGAFKVDSIFEKKVYKQFCSWGESENKEYPIGGTIYSILLPLEEKKATETFEIMNIREDNWHFDNKLYKLIPIKLEKAHLANIADGTQTSKDKAVSEIYDYIDFKITSSLVDIKDKKPIFLLDVTVLRNAIQIDATLKALESILCYNATQSVNFAVILDNINQIQHIIRELCAHVSVTEKMRKTQVVLDQSQIYLSNKNGVIQVLWHGQTLKEVIARDNTRALQRGTTPVIAELSKAEKTNDTIDWEKLHPDIDIPFAHIVKSGGETLFQLSVKHLLEQNIQQEKKHGYKIEDIHMRLGSKIHIHDFYQAEVIFQNNYYTKGFALTLARRIKDELQIIANKDASRVLLVGYERYSELMLYQLTDLLNRNNKENLDFQYTIFESSNNLFSPSLTKLIDNKAEKIIIIQIVPINSTLTTFSKMYYALKKQLNLIDHSPEDNLLLNLGLLLIKDKDINRLPNGKNYILENKSPNYSKAYPIEGDQRKRAKDKDKLVQRYWKELDPDKKTITTAFPIGDNNVVEYFIAVDTVWEDPLECTKCYPSNYKKEEPLFETNKASVIPSVQFGVQENQSEKSKYKALPAETAAFYENYLKGNIMYGHTCRNSNHFQYYLKTEDIFTSIKKDQNKISNWLERIKKVRSPISSNVCNIIVSPMHYTNAGFLHEVNYWYFDEAALILHSEIEKEFRDNFQSKYKYITLLMERAKAILKNSSIKKKFIFNFYFVDDTIVSGARYSRAKSLIKSLLPVNGEADNLECNVFKGVFLLVNRCSNSTKLKYVESKEDFHSFIELYIPSLRTHDDACILCNIRKESLDFYRKSATNQMADYWEKRTYKHTVKSMDEHEKEVDKKIEKKRTELRIDPNELRKDLMEKEYRRLYCSAVAHYNLNQCNNDEYARSIIAGMIEAKLKEGSESPIEWFISYIKILSRPFPSFRKSTRKAVLNLMINALSQLINKDDSNGITPAINEFLAEVNKISNIASEKRAKKVMLDNLINRLTAMGSNFILRKGIFEKIKKSYEAVYDFNNIDDTNKFNSHILKNIKKLVEIFGDDTKALRLENEFNIHEPNGEIPTLFNGKLGLDIFMENNRIFRDGINELLEKEEILEKLNNLSENEESELEEELKEIFSDNPPYYLANFAQLINENITQAANKKIEFLKHFLRFSNQLQPQNGKNNCDIKEDYKKLLGDLAYALEPESIILLTNKNDLSKNSGDSIKFQPVVKLVEQGTQYVNIKSEFILDYDKQMNIKIWAAILKGTYYFNLLDNKIEAYILFDNNYSNSDRGDKQKIHNIVLKLVYKNNVDQNTKEDINNFFRLPRHISFGIKALLSQRYNFVKKIEEDFNNNLMQDFTEQEEHLALIQGIKNVEHSSENKEWSYWIAFKNCQEEIKKYTKKTKRLFFNYLSLCSNAMISKMYFDLLKNDTKEEKESAPACFLQPLEKVIILQDNILDLFKLKDGNLSKKLDITYGSGSNKLELSQYNIVATSGDESYLWVISALIWGLLQNALQHGPDDGEAINTTIYQELYNEEMGLHYLCIKSDNVECLDGNKLEEAMRQVHFTDWEKIENKTSKGMTLPVVYSFFSKLLERELKDYDGLDKPQILEDAVKIDTKDKSYFIIKLLILKKK